MELFIPEKLIESRKKIQSSRQLSKEAYDTFTPQIKQAVDRIYNTPACLRTAAGKAASEQDIVRLAAYLPYNYLRLDESVLSNILEVRLNREAAEVLYKQWQEAFLNSECNSFLRKAAVSSEAFRSVLRRHHIDESLFLDILGSPNIPLRFDELLAAKEFSGGAEFEERLLYFGVTPGSYLDMECKRALLTFCKRADYLSCSEDNLLDIIGSYDDYMLRRFLKNLLSRLSLSELQAYPKLAAFLRSCTGGKKSEAFAGFFNGLPEAEVQKYLDWINLCKLNAYFENDERSRFWKQYRYLNVVRYPGCDTVILEFPQHVAVEFLGTQRGTIYLCDKSTFKNVFYPQLEVLDNALLQQFFRQHKDQCIEYRNHSGRWQVHVGNMIEKRQIAEKIRI